MTLTTQADDPVLPDYGGAWVGGVVPALLGGDRDWLPAPAHGARAVVLLVLDGLGWNIVRDQPERLPTLAGMEGGPITTVLPSTTAAALTSIATGAAPAEHGVLGYRIRVGGHALNVLRWQVGKDEKAPKPEEVQPLPAFLAHRVPVVTKDEFRKTGFTLAHLRDVEFSGWRTVSALLERVRGHVEALAPVTYAYYDGVDKVAHQYGIVSTVHDTELMLVDRLVGDLLDRLPPDAALLVTADHGQVDVGPAGAVQLDAIMRMVAALSGEGRFRSLHARGGASRDLAEACEEAYGDRAWVMTRDQLFDERWVGAGGGGPGSHVRGRVGDVVLAARAPVMFVDPGQAKEPKMIAQHGSATAAEVQVPLLAARGRR